MFPSIRLLASVGLPTVILLISGHAQAAVSGTIGPSSTTVDVVVNVAATNANPGLNIPAANGQPREDGRPTSKEFSDAYGGPVQGLRTLDVPNGR